MEQVNVTLTETIKVLLDDKKFSTLRDILITMKPFDIAAVFENLQDEKMPILFRILPKELAAETFVEMDDETQEFLIHGFSDSELKEVVDELFVDDAVDLIEEMPANVVKRILRQAECFHISHPLVSSVPRRTQLQLHILLQLAFTHILQNGLRYFIT